MTAKEYYAELDLLMCNELGTIKGSEDLTAFPGWDSLAVLSYIAFADEEFDCKLSGSDVANCKTVNDLKCLLGNHVDPLS